MIEWIEILKVISLFLAILFGSINAARAYEGSANPAWNFISMSVGLTGFIYLQWL